jgi:hypothetical protein
MSHYNKDHCISYIHIVPNNHKHCKMSSKGKAQGSHSHRDKRPQQDPLHQEDSSMSFESPTTCEHLASSCEVFEGLFKLSSFLFSFVGVGTYAQVWGCQFTRRGSCLGQVRGDAVLFGFAGLLNRGLLCRSRRFLAVSCVVWILRWESPAQSIEFDVRSIGDPRLRVASTPLRLISGSADPTKPFPLFPTKKTRPFRSSHRHPRHPHYGQLTQPSKLSRNHPLHRQRNRSNLLMGHVQSTLQSPRKTWKSIKDGVAK